MQVKASIKNDHTDWVETFEIPRGEDPVNYVQDLISFFNDTLKPGELPRTLVKMEGETDFSSLSDSKLAYQIRNLYCEQMAIFAKNVLDEIWGDQAKKLKRYFLNHKRFDELLDVMISMRDCLRLDSLYDALDEASKRGWKTFKKVDNICEKAGI